MGVYLNETDLVEVSETLLIALTDAGQSNPNRNKIAKAILAAEGKAKSALGMNYKLPLKTEEETELIKQIVTDIAIWRLFKNSEELEIPKKVQRGYDDAKEELNLQAKRLRTLGADDTVEVGARKPKLVRSIR